MNYHPKADFSNATEIVPWSIVYLSQRAEIYCIVDAEDWNWLRQWRWNTITHKWTPRAIYARRNVGPERKTIYLHREIMMRAAPPPDITFECTHVVDHINGQTLDNRRANLRWATRAVNARNTRHSRAVPTVDQIIAGLEAQTEALGLINDIPF